MQLETAPIAQSPVKLSNYPILTVLRLAYPALTISFQGNGNKGSGSCSLLAPSASRMTLVLISVALHDIVCPPLRNVSNKLSFQRQLSPCLSPYYN